MKCQRCQKREATILIRQSINGKEKEYTLCQDCLYELGFANSFGFDLDNYLGSGFISPHVNSPSNQQNLSGTYNSGVFVPGKKETQVCSHCNTTLDEIRKKGKLGCSYCYESFEEQLGQVFRRIQSGDKHRGRKLAQTVEKNEIELLHRENEDLQMKIKKAVEIEDYISAAKWKTQILQNKEKIENLENLEKEKNGTQNDISEKSEASKSEASKNEAEANNDGKNNTEKNVDLEKKGKKETEITLTVESPENKKNDNKLKENKSGKKTNNKKSDQQNEIPKLDPKKKPKNGDEEGMK